MGIEACHGVFHASAMEHPEFIRFNAKGIPFVSCPALADYIRKNLHYIFVRDSARHGVLRYVYEGGVYRLYADDMLKGLIKNCIASYDAELIEMRKVDEAFRILTTDLNYIKDSDLNADGVDGTRARSSLHHTDSVRMVGRRNCNACIRRFHAYAYGRGCGN